MPCSSPVDVPRFVYDPNHGGRVKRYFRVPCGHCIDCLRVRQSQYAFRAEWEFLDPRNVCVLFCTFTYAPEFLLDNELSKLDMQRYIRRLKKSLSGVRVKYMICGEYGELFGRKHYHALLFFDKFVSYDVIARAWTFGIVDISPFTSARAGYVAKYSVKQIGTTVDDLHKVQPFLLISNSVGFYFLDKHGDFCRHNYITSWLNLSGYPVPLPRVFMERLFPPKDKRHSYNFVPAYKSYLAFVGDSFLLRLKRRCAYDANIKVQSALAGKSLSRYVGDVQFGVSFSSSRSFSNILSRVSYETGRY